MATGCDISAWICGLTAAWITHDVARPGQIWLAVLRGGLAVAALAVGCGLLGGLYRGRYQRGSFDELIGVGRAGCATALALAVLGGALVPGQRAGLQTVVGGTVLALLAMVGVRYTVIAGRQWARLTASSGVKILVFRAGYRPYSHNISSADGNQMPRIYGACDRLNNDLCYRRRVAVTEQPIPRAVRSTEYIWTSQNVQSTTGRSDPSEDLCRAILERSTAT